MQKAILMVLLTAASGNAAAELILVGSSNNGDVSNYVDSSTIRTSGNIVKLWQLIDLKVAQPGIQGTKYRSIRSQEEYDCKEERVRTLYLVWYKDNMGMGGIVHSDGEPNKWSPIIPGSVGERVWKFACNNK